MGSNYFDKYIMHDNEPSPNYIVYPYNYPYLLNQSDKTLFNRLNAFNIKDNLDIRTKSVDRMFLFINSDEQPYSDMRIDSLANSSKVRDITKYNVMGITEITKTIQ